MPSKLQYCISLPLIPRIFSPVHINNQRDILIVTSLNQVKSVAENPGNVALAK
ncbi:hypothetical protein BMETH_448_0 [methanotrophic bacterial endosymbiont of Bathymodiolus sp.]|nr:hypothetical protein BMETH_448_0 [methanotrophic bacterial endosymbiont of Bathymodiolus sp.]